MTEMRELIERYTVDKEALDQFYNVPHSTISMDRRQRFTECWLRQLRQVAFDDLDVEGRVDYHLLRNHIEETLTHIDLERHRLDQLSHTLPFLRELVALEEERRAMVPASAEELASRLKAIADAARGAGEKLEAAGEATDRPPLPQLEQARQATEAVLPVLKSWHAHYAGYMPEYAWWLREPYKEARAAIKACGKALTKAIGGTDKLIGAPIGREALEEAIRRQFIPYGPEDLIAIGERELAWCTERMLEASHELGCGDDWRAAIELVKQRHCPLGQQHRLVEELACEAIRYVDEHELVTIDDLCRETWYIDMIDEKGQKHLPFLGYGGQKILVSYPTDGMGHEAAKMAVRANNEHMVRAVTHHELIPGHHLQIYMGERHRAYRRIFHTPFLSEGWCLHWEMLLWDRGFARGPEDRVGMLFWLMHRCARITVSLRFHLGEMTPEQMIEYLIERVGHERGSATSEVRRYIGDGYGPLYQCAYMIGALQMRALYREMVTDGPMTDREFHDRVLREGAIPIEVLRAAIRDDLLGAEFHPQWRFAG